MKTSLIAAVTVLALVFAVVAPAAAQAPAGSTTNMEILVAKIKADKKLLVAETVGLTDAEGKRILDIKWGTMDPGQQWLAWAKFPAPPLTSAHTSNRPASGRGMLSPIMADPLVRCSRGPSGASLMNTCPARIAASRLAAVGCSRQKTHVVGVPIWAICGLWRKCASLPPTAVRRSPRRSRDSQ